MERFTFEQDTHGGFFFLYDDQTKLGEVTFRKRGEDEIVINHTYVKPEFEGRGFGKKLVDKVLEHAQSEGLKVSATCWFAEKVMQSKPNA
ncbi:MAG: GNAT family N-acetyltransferase [Moheibacter sp.]